MDRRNFIKGILAASIAPAFIPYANLMKLGYKRTESGILVDSMAWYYEFKPGDIVQVEKLSDAVKEFNLRMKIISKQIDLPENSLKMELVECQNVQMLLPMSTLSISIDLKNQELQTCSELESTLKKSLISAGKKPRKY